MSGKPQNQEIGPQGGYVDLDVRFYQYQGGPLVDDDDYSTLGALPTVEIYDPTGTLVQTSTTPTRISIGSYYFRRLIGLSDTISNTWKIKWKLKINGIACEFEEYFIVVAAGSPGFGTEDCRKGYAFNNPDVLANNEWGAIITPDELRYVYAFGNDLVAANAQTITDDTLKWYVDNAIGNIEKDLSFTIMKKIIKYRPKYGVTRSDLPVGAIPDIDFFWEDPYDFRRKEYKNFIFIKLRRCPVLEVSKVLWKDAMGNEILDITNWLDINYEKGSLEFFPNNGGTEALVAQLGISSSIEVIAGMRWMNYPDAFFIDYNAGFETCAHFRAKCPELFQIVGMLAAINLLNDYGDGRAAAIASSSIGLAGVSESYSTTMSATNAMFGARIIQFWKQLDKFYKYNKNKYCGIVIGAL